MENNEIDFETKVFPTTFFLLKIAGLWKPSRIKYRPISICYQLYTLIPVCSLLWMIISLIINIFINAISNEQLLSLLIDCLYLIIVWFNGFVKILNLTIRRGRIIKIIKTNILGPRWEVRDGHEKRIIEETKRSEKKLVVIYAFIVFITTLSLVLKPVIYENPNNELIIDTYIYCNKSITSCFWIFYCVQCYVAFNISMIVLTCDCLLFSFVDMLSAELKILQHRFSMLPHVIEKTANKDSNAIDYGKSYLVECVKDHRSIYVTAEEMNNIFYESVCLQFVSSISALCTNIFLLSKQKIFSENFFPTLIYLCYVLIENFCYCWYGYKISVSSADVVNAILNMNWIILREDLKKMLLFIMLLATKEITVFRNAIVNLSPEMFVKIVKISYSAFNLLKQF